MDVEVQWGTEVLPGLVTDVSTVGMFIAMGNPLWVGASFTAKILLGEPIEVPCVVRRVLPGRGMGVGFENVGDKTRAQLKAFIRRISE